MSRIYTVQQGLDALASDLDMPIERFIRDRRPTGFCLDELVAFGEIANAMRFHRLYVGNDEI